jgi:hypothetical protein
VTRRLEADMMGIVRSRHLNPSPAEPDPHVAADDTWAPCPTRYEDTRGRHRCKCECKDRTGRHRAVHTLDGDGRCIFCDKRQRARG